MKSAQISINKFYFRSNLKNQWTELRAKLNEWRIRHKTRIQLASLNDRSLQDIGVSRYDANKEAEKPFWME